MYTANQQRLLTSIGLRHEIVLLPEKELDQRVLQMCLLPDDQQLKLQVVTPTRDGVTSEQWTLINSLDDLFNFLASLSNILPEPRLIDIAVQVDMQIQNWKYTWAKQARGVVPESN